MKRIIRNLLLFGLATAMFTACGDEPEVTKKEENSNGNVSNGAISNGEFTIAQDKKVRFSQGNLQYQASTRTWRFANNQWDIVGNASKGTVYENEVKSNNNNVAEDYDGWIDVFGWGTSGYNDKYPYMTSKDSTDYGDGENDIAGTNYDWGVYNAISNGGNKVGMWRTLTSGEWNYLFHSRPHCNQLYSTGRVDGINGLILLPDDWEQKESVNFTAKSRDYITNDYTIKEWRKMEADGAVFLPAAGYRYDTDVTSVGYYGHYWSSSACDNLDAHILLICSDCAYYYCDTTPIYRRRGSSVRLVQDVK